MTTKKYASKKEQIQFCKFEKENPVGSKIIKRAFRHNLDGSKQWSLVTQSFNEIRKARREVQKFNK